MYSTNLHIGIQEHMSDIFDQDNQCIGAAYGWTGYGPNDGPSQTAKDNALLWSLAPEAIAALEFLRDSVMYQADFGKAYEFSLARAVLDKLSSAMHSEVGAEQAKP